MQNVQRMDTPEETTKRASLLIRAGEVAGNVQDEDAIRKAFYRKSKRVNAGRSAGEVHAPPRSGLTFGFGHDIGQASEAEIDRFYGPQAPLYDYPPPSTLTSEERAVLKRYVGKKVVKMGKGSAAFKATQGVDMTYEEATEVFEKHLLPKYIEAAKTAYPGFEDLPTKQQAAIVNRTYMRGSGPNKNEGKKGYTAWVELHDAIFKRDTKAVYLALKNMERLHKNSKKASSTQGRARSNTALAYEGYLETTRTGPR